ncbi:MAG: efflux RND transporter periplasmic adaptor subunit [Planctomycetota bacterium]|nr:efflux RND transporter periplasmic adaptor subunit [Planctomycetota bacterium]
MLAKLDTELLEAERHDREIQLDRAKTSVSMLELERRNLDLRESRLKLQDERQKVALERSGAQLDLARKNLKRYEDMNRVDAASETDVEIRTLEKENAERDKRLAALDLDNLRIDAHQVAADREALDARLRQAEAEVAQAQQALAKAAANLRYASIAAPCEGVVLDRAVEPGQTIAANFQTPELFTIVSDLHRVRILVKIDEADVGRIAAGQKVEFEVDAYRDMKFQGQVRAVRLKHELRGNLVTYPVQIEADNPPAEGCPHGKLRPGMTAYVTFEVAKKKDIVRIPAAALRFVPPKDTPLDLPAANEAQDAAPKGGKPNQPPPASPPPSTARVPKGSSRPSPSASATRTATSTNSSRANSNPATNSSPPPPPSRPGRPPSPSRRTANERPARRRGPRPRQNLRRKNRQPGPRAPRNQLRSPRGRLRLRDGPLRLRQVHPA